MHKKSKKFTEYDTKQVSKQINNNNVQQQQTNEDMKTWK